MHIPSRVLRPAEQDGFERLMNLVVGTLLFGAVAVLVFVQSHPPV